MKFRKVTIPILILSFNQMVYCLSPKWIKIITKLYERKDIDMEYWKLKESTDFSYCEENSHLFSELAADSYDSMAGSVEMNDDYGFSITLDGQNYFHSPAIVKCTAIRPVQQEPLDFYLMIYRVKEAETSSKTRFRLMRIHSQPEGVNTFADEVTWNIKSLEETYADESTSDDMKSWFIQNENRFDEDYCAALKQQTVKSYMMDYGGIICEDAVLLLREGNKINIPCIILCQASYSESENSLYFIMDKMKKPIQIYMLLDGNGQTEYGLELYMRGEAEGPGWDTASDPEDTPRASDEGGWGGTLAYDEYIFQTTYGNTKSGSDTDESPKSDSNGGENEEYNRGNDVPGAYKFINIWKP